jgi:hypothetical protein
VVSPEFGDVRYGSKADIEARQSDVRYSPKSGHSVARLRCPLCAISGLMHRSKKDRYSITSLAVVSNECG